MQSRAGLKIWAGLVTGPRAWLGIGPRSAVVAFGQELNGLRTGVSTVQFPGLLGPLTPVGPELVRDNFWNDM